MRLTRFIPLALLLAGCTDNNWDETPAGDSGNLYTDLSTTCTAGQTRCVGQSYDTCANGAWQQKWLCPAGKECVVNQGCLDCDPARGTVCVGNDVYTCVGVGKTGTLQKQCLGLVCERGQCNPPSCAVGSKLVYVVDSTYRLLSFDPSKEKNHFTLIAKLSCPAGSPWPLRPAPATPFSMSIDRSARAWVLYTSGEIFWVSTKDGACTKSPYAKGQQSYQLFGMGFVSDSAGSAAEKIYVTRARILGTEAQQLGHIDPASLSLTSVGTMPASEQSAELTGTSQAELYGYFPGASKSFVAQVDKTTGKAVKTWSVTPAGQVMAWAFAHWGGKFYIFVTTGTGLTEKSQVLRLDPQSGQVTTFLSSIPYRIVGAGVSTCAPIIG